MDFAEWNTWARGGVSARSGFRGGSALRRRRSTVTLRSPAGPVTSRTVSSPSRAIVKRPWTVSGVLVGFVLIGGITWFSFVRCGSGSFGCSRAGDGPRPARHLSVWRRLSFQLEASAFGQTFVDDVAQTRRPRLDAAGRHVTRRHGDLTLHHFYPDLQQAFRPFLVGQADAIRQMRFDVDDRR